MRARFIGDPNDDYSGPDVLHMMGKSFPRDEWVEIDDDDVARKIEGNTHFDVEYSDMELATDGSPITDLPKRKGGWPKGKPRKPRHAEEQS